MKETGLITEITRNECVVRFNRKAACDNCNMCFRTKDDMYVELVVENTLDAKVGDSVEVEIPDKSVLKASFLAYIVPASAFLIGLVATKNMEDWASISIAIAALAIAYIGVMGAERYLRKKKGFIPRMTTLIKKEGDVDEE